MRSVRLLDGLELQANLLVRLNLGAELGLECGVRASQLFDCVLAPGKLVPELFDMCITSIKFSLGGVEFLDCLLVLFDLLGLSLDELIVDSLDLLDCLFAFV